MITRKDVIKKIKDLGLNSYEAKIWLALLSRGVSTAGELSDIADVPRSRSYDVLESLEKKGFIIMKLGKPIKYIAVPPEEVLERIKKRIKTDAEEKEELIKQLEGSELIEELNLLHKGGIEFIDSTELSTSLKGKENIYSHLSLMLKKAKSKFILATTSQGLDEKARILGKHFKKAKEDGVDIRIIVPKIPNSKEVNELSKVVKIKEVENINTRFCIVDDKEVFFAITNEKEVHPSFDTGVWVNTPFFSKTLSQFFENLWGEKNK